MSTTSTDIQQKLFDFNNIDYDNLDIPYVQSETDRYTYVKALNAGSFGEVYLVYDEQEQREAAMKVMSFDKASIDDCLYEAHLASILDHPNIVRTYDCFQTETELFIVSEYLGGGDLFDRINPLMGIDDEKRVKKYFAQIVKAVKFIHSCGLSHRDLKPENIMLSDDDEIKLIDFGLSGNGDEEVNSLTGTLSYMSPEVYRKSSFSNGKAADIWALGVILYTMIVGNVPFDSPSQHDPGYKSFCSQDSKFDQPEWTPELHELFSGIFHPSLKSRWTIEEVEAFLEKSLFKSSKSPIYGNNSNQQIHTSLFREVELEAEKVRQAEKMRFGGTSIEFHNDFNTNIVEVKHKDYENENEVLSSEEDIFSGFNPLDMVSNLDSSFNLSSDESSNALVFDADFSEDDDLFYYNPSTPRVSNTPATNNLVSNTPATNNLLDSNGNDNNDNINGNSVSNSYMQTKDTFHHLREKLYPPQHQYLDILETDDQLGLSWGDITDSLDSIDSIDNTESSDLEDQSSFDEQIFELELDED
eukprot:Awhi_evm1s312